MKKRVLAMMLTLCMIMMLFPTSANALNMDWSEAYKEFILGGGFQSSGQEYGYTEYGSSVIKYDYTEFGLYDLDQNGVPELIAYRGASSRVNMRKYVYTFKNDAVQYLGRFGAYETPSCFAPSSAYSGLFDTWMQMGSGDCSYITIENGVYSQSTVYSYKEKIDYTDPTNPQFAGYEYTQKTTDNDLFKTARDIYDAYVIYNNDYPYIVPMYTVSQISDMSWRGFIDQYESMNSQMKAAQKPTINTHPQDYTGIAGDTAVFYIEASGENLTYQWQYSDNRGDTWINTGSNTMAVDCEITSSCFGRLYRCVVSNAIGKAVSNTAKIIRDDTPSSTSGTNFFVIGQDSNSFLHSEIGSYQTSLHYINKLIKGMSSTEILSLYDTINSMVESKEETQDSFGNTCHLWVEEWGGSCQGLSTLLGLCNLKKINPIQFQGTYGVQANCFSDVIYSEDLRNAVNYYHLLQYTDQWPSPTMKVYNASLPARVMANVIGSFESGWTPLSNVKSFWNSLAKAAKAGSETHVPLLFSFGNTEGVGHTILICGYSENQNHHIFKLYDCNSTNPRLRNLLPNRQQNYIYLFVSKSDQSFMLSSTGDTITELGLYLNQDNWKYFEYYNADIWNQLDTQTEKARTLSVTSEETVTFMVDAGKAFKMVNSEGSTLQLKENTFSGDMEVYAFDILGDNQYYRFSIPVSDQYTITDFKDGTNFRVLGSDYYASAITQKTNAITFQNQRGIILDGKAISFVASVGGANNSSLTRLESSGSNHVSIQNHADGVNIHSDKKSPVTVSVISDGVETNRGTTPANEIIQLDNQGKINSKTDEILFKDVDLSSWYADAVQWAVNHTPQITNGTSATTFSPNANCTRAQMVTFLWRAAGEPKVNGSNPFKDVKSSAYYYYAVLWAVENGITYGTSQTTFSPNNTVTRGQTVTFLWRMEGEPKVNTSNPFKDVKSGQFYTNAVLWAVKNGITYGTSETTFSPNNPCTRAQIVTLLYRDLT